MSTLLRCVFALGLVAGVALPALAAEEHPLLTAPLTQAPGKKLVALTVTFAPGQQSKPHHHEADAFVYMLSGRVRSQVDREPAREYGPGESWFEPAGAHHLGTANVSGTEPATFLVVFVARPDARLTVPEQAAPDQISTPARTQSR
ncbi:cupin domain-containing protein [Dyella sp. SG609]|uniref:cupin domain-containing protein n=1 Tax=Dyella sp. SG609 TaxID=2587018 RepID=UPI001447602F|nr:cupin domain-containing protein [Dyella sp. SG609]NKJ23076.1 quercetin dioxygenase-like cupin family protein [Dyella sp. SG609]